MRFVSIKEYKLPKIPPAISANGKAYHLQKAHPITPTKNIIGQIMRPIALALRLLYPITSTTFSLCIIYFTTATFMNQIIFPA